VQDDFQKRTVALSEECEDCRDDVSRKGASAEQANTDQSEAKGVTRQGQHGDLPRNACAGQAQMP
jgi:hypothetical protein